MITVSEWKIPRKVYGGRFVEDIWRRRINKELQILYGKPNIFWNYKSTTNLLL